MFNIQWIGRNYPIPKGVVRYEKNGSKYAAQLCGGTVGAFLGSWMRYR